MAETVSPFTQQKAGPVSVVRTFITGANRDVEGDKHDYEGFLSPLVLHRFGAYMTLHRHLRDGQIRDSDNWQKGIPLRVYMKSLLRHVVDLWRLHRGYSVMVDGHPADFESLLCAILFNAQGYLHETLLRQIDVPVPISEPRT